MKPSTFLVSFLVFLLVILTIFFGRGFFSSVRDKTELFFASVSRSSGYDECGSLARENELLKFELSKYENDSEGDVEEGKTAEVFSRYPFNNKERLTVNIGMKDGIEVGLPVLSPEGYLLGSVSAVRNNQSEVQTIFDPEWRLSVAVGDASVKAVVNGSQSPELDLISKESEVKEGDYVFSISPDFPYGKLVGKVRSVEGSVEETWYTASIEIPYDIDEITEVIILAGFGK